MCRTCIDLHTEVNLLYMRRITTMEVGESDRMHIRIFRVWAVKTYAGTGGNKGKLADDMKADRQFISGRSKQRNLAMLKCREASSGVLDTFEEMWVEYEDYKRECLNA